MKSDHNVALDEEISKESSSGLHLFISDTDSSELSTQKWIG